MRILVAVDVHDQPERVLSAAMPWAALLGGRVDVGYASPWATVGMEPPETRARLDEVFDAVPEPMRGQSHLYAGRAVDALPLAAADYDMVVTSTRSRTGLERVLLGSVTARLLRVSPAPVLVLRLGDVRRPPERAPNVICPIDHDGMGALRWVQAHLPGAPIEVVHAVPAPGWGAPRRDARDRLDNEQRRRALSGRVAARMRAHRASDPRVSIITCETSNAGDAVAAYAAVNDADLVVMPTHKRTGLDRWMLGSVAERVVEKAPCPVIVVPASALQAVAS